MKRTVGSAGLAVTILVAIPLILGIGLSTAFSAGGPKEIPGYCSPPGHT